MRTNFKAEINLLHNKLLFSRFQMQACVALELFSRQTGMIIAKQHVQGKKNNQTLENKREITMFVGLFAKKYLTKSRSYFPVSSDTDVIWVSVIVFQFFRAVCFISLLRHLPFEVIITSDVNTVTGKCWLDSLILHSTCGLCAVFTVRDV